MEAILDGVAFLSVTLHKEPDDVIMWKESRFAFWIGRIFNQWHDLQVLSALTITGTFWDAKSVVKAADERKKDKRQVSSKSKEEAMRRAAQIAAMPGSGAVPTPGSEG